jgi:hypothetical protein
MIGRVAFWVGLYVGLVVEYAVTMNCGVDVNVNVNVDVDVDVIAALGLILFTC